MSPPLQSCRDDMFIENRVKTLLSPVGRYVIESVYRSRYVAPTELKSWVYTEYYKHIVPTGLNIRQSQS